ncbi:hypothetical protein pdam_00010412 [Pocillopora damicornis]|uniref:Uncharacterized protein n=1 Tax=Pocillopora damicornis TaxID=46731 RepID=A0A3M6UR04_POCDA|nr:hypothetical protein pdam_00010412 [Pocillopora damicornis]
MDFFILKKPTVLLRAPKVLQHILHRHAILKESDQNLLPMSDQKRTHIRMALININEIFMLLYTGHLPTTERNICFSI